MDAKTQPARGMRDFLPADVRRRDYVIRKIKEVYERFGFEPLETPAVENIETLLGKYGPEGNQLIFKILKRGVHESSGEADMALRYDLTVPLARVVAEYKSKLPKYFKRYQIQPVWRADRPARGRFREFYQCDVDIIGSRSALVESELCAATSEALASLGFDNFTIRLNHREVLRAILRVAGIAEDLHDQALVALDKLEKIGAAGVRKELDGRGVAQTASERLLEFFEGISGLDAPTRIIASDTGDSEEFTLSQTVLGRLVEFIGGDDRGAAGIEELRNIVVLSKANGTSRRIRIDPSLARGLTYYTGSIMEISVPDLEGSLGGGGRYDNLIGMFIGEDVPACGFSLGLERIIVVMEERGMFSDNAVGRAAEVMVALLSDETAADALKLATELRQGGLNVDLYPEPEKLGKQFKYASNRGVQIVALVGAEELEKGVVAIKNLKTGQQVAVSRSTAAEFINSQPSSQRDSS